MIAMEPMTTFEFVVKACGALMGALFFAWLTIDDLKRDLEDD